MNKGLVLTAVVGLGLWFWLRKRQVDAAAVAPSPGPVIDAPRYRFLPVPVPGFPVPNIPIETGPYVPPVVPRDLPVPSAPGEPTPFVPTFVEPTVALSVSQLWDISTELQRLTGTVTPNSASPAIEYLRANYPAILSEAEGMVQAMTSSGQTYYHIGAALGDILRPSQRGSLWGYYVTYPNAK